MVANTRTRVSRLPEKQVRDESVRDAVLDAGLVAHVAVLDRGQPFVIPVGYARDGDQLLIHGSTGSRLFRLLATGGPSCLTVTLLDGVVVARSQFESSMHYRSVVVLGSFAALAGRAKEAGLAVLAGRLLPGLADRRPPSAKELAKTSVLALSLQEWSLKVSAGDPDDEPEDLALPVWAGVVPLRHGWGEPRPAPDLAPEIAVPDALERWPGGRS